MASKFGSLRERACLFVYDLKAQYSPWSNCSFYYFGMSVWIFLNNYSTCIQIWGIPNTLCLNTVNTPFPPNPPTPPPKQNNENSCKCWSSTSLSCPDSYHIYLKCLVSHASINSQIKYLLNSFTSSKQCRPWSDTAFCSIWSGSALLANCPFAGVPTEMD